MQNRCPTLPSELRARTQMLGELRCGNARGIRESSFAERLVCCLLLVGTVKKERKKRGCCLQLFQKTSKLNVYVNSLCVLPVIQIAMLAQEHI